MDLRRLRSLGFPAFLLLATTVSAAPYHLELEVTPSSAFPYLGRFGNVDLHVYEGGVSAKALWLRAFSRNDAQDVTVVNPLARMYFDVNVGEIASMMARFAGKAGAIERDAEPVFGPRVRGEVKGVPATRHRLVYGPNAWIDVWTTDVIPENGQLRSIVQQAVRGISPATGKLAEKISGTPIFVELNFRRFQKVPLLRLKKLSRTAEDEQDALTLGRLYIRASVFEKLLTN
jgi:hypothetical protein